MKILTGNYIFNRGGILTGGVRWLGERFSADLALVVPRIGHFPMIENYSLFREFLLPELEFMLSA